MSNFRKSVGDRVFLFAEWETGIDSKGTVTAISPDAEKPFSVEWDNGRVSEHSEDEIGITIG